WLRRGRSDEAGAAFERACEYVANHPMAGIGLAAAGHAAGRVGPPAMAPGPRGSVVERAICEAAGLLLEGPARGRDAATKIDRALAEAPPGTSDGWLIPVDPFLRVHAAPEAWTHVLARLRSRAL